MFEHPHSGFVIYNALTAICREYGINNNIISICFDNASNNNVAIGYLKNTFKRSLDGILFHCRCSYHVINLIVQDGVTHIREYLENIKKILLFIQCSTSRYQEFR